MKINFFICSDLELEWWQLDEDSFVCNDMIIYFRFRFLYFPNMFSCCFCCEQKKSDWGLQAPDWLEGAKYDGSYIIPVFNGSYSYLSAYKWEVKVSPLSVLEAI